MYHVVSLGELSDSALNFHTGMAETSQTARSCDVIRALGPEPPVPLKQCTLTSTSTCVRLQKMRQQGVGGA